MVFLAGPRQVGKTTTSRSIFPDALYLNWDNTDHRSIILKGPAAVATAAGTRRLAQEKPVVIFDELHKFRRWKIFLKGFNDTYGPSVRICVTGSARLNVYKQGGDSLMGRYFLLHMHPLSIRECAEPSRHPAEINAPVPLADADFNVLMRFGGYPEPFLRREQLFYNRWRRQRMELLFKEDVRDLSHINDIARLTTLARYLAAQAGGTITYSSLANNLQVSVDTIRRWIEMLESVFYCFRLYPYSRNVARSLLKEPKIYMCDWSLCTGDGARHENFVACHLFKAVQYYSDVGLGDFGLWYLRDKDGREVDFLITRDNEPWFICEVKTADTVPAPSLFHFRRMLDVPHAFQAVINEPFVNADCFSRREPTAVPARSLLSQLV
ncbi:MAG: ATP-binding protein [Chitinispirillaceae bacterium]|nr:ATP-binding protein [Chitinispirillaceae bacterium]